MMPFVQPLLVSLSVADKTSPQSVRSGRWGHEKDTVAGADTEAFLCSLALVSRWLPSNLMQAPFGQSTPAYSVLGTMRLRLSLIQFLYRGFGVPCSCNTHVMKNS